VQNRKRLDSESEATFHITLTLLGLDDNKLTFYHAGRFKQLSQFGGKVIEDLIA
jgi:hypothetical protein